MHFHIAIISLIFQQNALVQLNICIVYEISPTYFGTHYAILRENSLTLLKTTCLL